MTDQQHANFIESVVDWLHTGCPDGVPPKDYYPLLAFAERGHCRKTRWFVASRLLRERNYDNPVTATQIHQAIRDVTAKGTEPGRDASGGRTAGLGGLAARRSDGQTVSMAGAPDQLVWRSGACSTSRW